MEKNRIHAILCDCGAEVLVIEKEENDIYFSIFKNYCEGKLSLADRFKMIWHILTKGTVYYDQIILNFDKVKELKKVLNSFLK